MIRLIDHLSGIVADQLLNGGWLAKVALTLLVAGTVIVILLSTVEICGGMF